MILTIKKRNNSSRKRFVFSLVTGVFITSMLVVGSVGSLLQQTDARSYRERNYYSERRDDGYQSYNNGRTNDSYTNQTYTHTSDTDRQQYQVTQPTQETPPSPTVQVAPVAPAAPPTPQITQAPAIVREAPTPVDTAADVVAMTAAQATTSGQSVAYTSQKISAETRDRLMILAGAAAVAGGLLYTLSYVGSLSTSRRPIPVRYIVPVREVVTN